MTARTTREKHAAIARASRSAVRHLAATPGDDGRRSKVLEMDEETLGKVAFTAYSETKNWKTYDGKQIPAWNDLPHDVRTGWELAARAVEQAITLRIIKNLSGK